MSETTLKPLSFFKAYGNNPRDNAKAVDAVAASIKEFGFLVPIVTDANGEIAAGHTRFLAAKKLRLKNAPVIIASHLSSAQLQQFRLIDNKVSELAEWNMDMLAQEINALADSGLDFTRFGWAQEEIDCLSDMVADDCMGDVVTAESDGVNSAVAAHQGRAALSKDSKSVSISIGEYRFFIPRTDYQAWADRMRKANNYDDDAILISLATTLGMLEGYKQHHALKQEKNAAASKAIQEVNQQQAARTRVRVRK